MQRHSHILVRLLLYIEWGLEIHMPNEQGMVKCNSSVQGEQVQCACCARQCNSIRIHSHQLQQWLISKLWHADRHDMQGLLHTQSRRLDEDLQCDIQSSWGI